MIVLCGSATFASEEEGEILRVLNCVFDGPAVVFVSTAR